MNMHGIILLYIFKYIIHIHEVKNLFIYLFFFMPWSYKLVLHYSLQISKSTHGTQKSTKQYQKSNRYQIVEKDNDH